MIIYLAGGYLKDTGDYLIKYRANKLFSYYDIANERVNMNLRFFDTLKIKQENYENISGNMA